MASVELSFSTKRGVRSLAASRHLQQPKGGNCVRVCKRPRAVKMNIRYGEDCPLKIFVKIAAILLLLSGCATPYQPQKSAYGYGYSETQLAENIFSVRFIGSGADGAPVVSDYALLRAAEVTLEHGYTHFGIVDSKDEIKYSSVTVPATTVYTPNIFAGTTTATTSGGGTYIGYEPQSFKTIVCYKGKPEDDKGVVFDAAFLKESLRKKYELDKKPDKQK